MKLKYVFSLSLIAFLVVSCKKDKTPEPVAPTAEVCPEEISFSTFIQPLMTNNCAGCHDGTLPPNVSNYSEISAAADGIWVRINSSDNDPLLMPSGGPKLHADSLQKFKCWIDQGKLNN